MDLEDTVDIEVWVTQTGDVIQLPQQERVRPLLNQRQSWRSQLHHHFQRGGNQSIFQEDNPDIYGRCVTCHKFFIEEIRDTQGIIFLCFIFF